MTKRQLYELESADGTRFSPYCWRIKLALAHKNLSYESVPWHFTDKEAIAFSGQSKVPVLVDGGIVVADSQVIAEYLEAAYPNEASLFNDSTSRGLIHFVKSWTESVLHPAIAPIVLPDTLPRLTQEDQVYFRRTREAYYQHSIEEFATRREAALFGFSAALTPLRGMLKVQKFISGTAPAYADHIVFGALKWAVQMSSTPLLQADDDAIAVWMASVLATYDL
ncbi:MAG: glutathione S-transferase N-terminal domain-containing protein [Acidocella sp.]|nr:glutathione S-transferase N-terminal domain-containing protein [Acidocella sp.]